jgi:hypothetical protein
VVEYCSLLLELELQEEDGDTTSGLRKSHH